MSDQTNAAARPGRPGDFNMLPLDEPTNVFKWTAVFLGEMIKLHPKLATPEVRHRIAWLLEMGRLLPNACHDRPHVILTLGECATSSDLRRGVMATLLDLEKLHQEALKNT